MSQMTLELTDELSQFLCTRQPILCLDFDGTLTPTRPDPENSELSPAMLELLQQLAERFTVLIISGRQLEDVWKRVKLWHVYYAGNHGYEMSGPGVHDYRVFADKPDRQAMQRAFQQFTDKLHHIRGLRIENKHYTLSLHYGLVASDKRHIVRSVVDKLLAQEPALMKRQGKMVYEIRPKQDWDKGRAVVHFIDWLGHYGQNSLPIYIGDDQTDEDAFVTLSQRDSITICVGDKLSESAAAYYLPGVSDVQRFLEWLKRLPYPKAREPNNKEC